MSHTYIGRAITYSHETQETKIYIYMYKSFIKSRSITWDNHTIPTKQMPWRAEGRSERNIEFLYIFIYFFLLRWDMYGIATYLFFFYTFFLMVWWLAFFLLLLLFALQNSTLCLSVFLLLFYLANIKVAKFFNTFRVRQMEIKPRY